MNWKRITVDTDVMQGKPCVRHMRIAVSLVVNLVANGMTVPQILKEYPDLEAQDIQECLQYAACLTDERVSPLEEWTGAVS